MKKSIELEILIEAIKLSLLEKPSEKLIFLLKSQKIDWQRLEKLASFHSIRPVLYDAFQRIGFENEYSKKLKSRTFTQSVINLSISQELSRLLTLLQHQNIRVLPYKGLLFISEFYENKPLRETHDLDLLIHPEDAQKALNILLNDGYTLDIANKNNLCDAQFIDTILNTFRIIEIGLDKKNSLGTDIHIDFHWQLFEKFYNFNIDFKAFFEQQQRIEYLGKTVFFPSKEAQFLMLLNHHGGREAWCRLKHFCDLIAFLKTTNFSYQELLKVSTKVGMKKIFEVGFDIYLNVFLEDFSQKKTLPIQSKIYNYWEIGELWIKLFNKFRIEYIQFELADNFSLKKLIVENYLFFSMPNLIENPRLITFPEQFRFLNFCSKVITFIWKHTWKNMFTQQKVCK